MGNRQRKWRHREKTRSSEK